MLSRRSATNRKLRNVHTQTHIYFNKILNNSKKEYMVEGKNKTKMLVRENMELIHATKNLTKNEIY